jgi:acetyltransferase
MPLAVRPNLAQWHRHLVPGNGRRFLVRPIKPDDEHLIHDLLLHATKEDLRLRFFESFTKFSPAFLAKLTHFDYASAMAFVAIDEVTGDTLGVVRLHSDMVHETGEYAILLRSCLKGRGLGWALMQLIIEYAKSAGLKRISGQILQQNSAMLKMCRELGFEVKTDAEDPGLCNVMLSVGNAIDGSLR